MGYNTYHVPWAFTTAHTKCFPKENSCVSLILIDPFAGTRAVRCIKMREFARVLAGVQEVSVDWAG